VSTVRFTSTDGVELVAHDLGGEGQPALLVHGAGVNGLCLRPFARHLSARFACWALDLRGHGASSAPPDFGWAGFVDDVRAAVDRLELHNPVAVGHSLGATAILGAEAGRPGTFARLFCYESIVFAPEVPDPPDGGIAEVTRRRRAVFASRSEAADRFRENPHFRNWDPDALAGYLEGGLVDLPDGSVELACPPENEARIYEAARHFEIYGRLGAIRCPVAIARGSASNVLSAAAADTIAARLVNGAVEEFAGLGHSGPCEDPAAVAAAFLSAVDTAGA
jgi:pimeloyl-ACP methyl ester carboxylesterase